MYEDKAKLDYMDTDSFIVNVKTKYIFLGVQDVETQDFETRFDTSSYDAQLLLPLGKEK